MTLQTLLLNRAVALPVVDARLLDVDRIASRNVSGTRTVHVRRYRVKASVSLLSIPLFSRDEVGAACVMAEELAAGTGRTSAIQFSAGSWPDRIGGCNRFGMTQELHVKARCNSRKNRLSRLAPRPRKKHFLTTL